MHTILKAAAASVAATAVGALAMTAAFMTGEAWPHDAVSGWSYPFACCSGLDCREVPDDAVRERADGYHVPSGEVVAYNDRRVRNSPDGKFHWCSVAGADDGDTICLFVPPRAY